MTNIIVKQEQYGIRVTIDDFEIGLDNSATRYNLLSHAHSDHILGRANNTQVITSPKTATIFEKKRGYRVKMLKSVDDNDTITLENAVITAFNAGHVLGSLQFLIEYKNKRILYTGDLNTEDSIFLKGGKPFSCDILIVDSTYGHPRFLFPPRKNLYSQLIELVFKIISEGKIPLIRAYSLGKAQEAIALLQHLKIPIISGNSIIERINDVHRSYGINLKSHSIESVSKEIISSNELIFIVSNTNMFFKNLRRRFGKEAANILSKKVWPIPLTGWSLLNNKGLPLSGHSDFVRLLEFVKRSNPEHVITFTSNGKFFATHLQKLGFNALYLTRNTKYVI